MIVFKTLDFVVVLFADGRKMKKCGVAISQCGPFELGFKGKKFFLQKDFLVLSGEISF